MCKQLSIDLRYSCRLRFLRDPMSQCQSVSLWLNNSQNSVETVCLSESVRDKITLVEQKYEN